VGTAAGIIAIVALIAANACFVAVEFAMVAVDRSELRRRAELGSRTAGIAARLLDRLSFHLSGAQFGITVVSLGLGVLAEPVLAPIVAPVLEPLLGAPAGLTWSVVLALALTTVVQLVVGELIPKGVAVARPVTTVTRLAPAMAAFNTVFRPVIWASNRVADGLLRLVGVEPADELSGVRSREELRRMVAASGAEGSIAPAEHQLLARAFRFLDKNAADAMTPRPEVVSVPDDSDTGAVIDASVRTGLSRILLHHGSIDELRGVVHVKEVLGLDAADRRSSPAVHLARRVPFVPETAPLEDVLRQLREDGLHLAAVIDEFGSVAGVVTIEDLLEEIVGEIDDEYDTAAPEVAPLDDGAFRVSSRMHVDDFADLVSVDVEGEEEGVDTVLGLMAKRLGRVPIPGATVDIDGWRLTAERGIDRRNRIATVLAMRVPGDDPADGDE